MDNIIVIAVVALILGLACLYIHRAKKHGVKCIGCPNGVNCSRNCSGCSSTPKQKINVSELAHSAHKG